MKLIIQYCILTYSYNFFGNNLIVEQEAPELKNINWAIR